MKERFRHYRLGQESMDKHHEQILFALEEVRACFYGKKAYEQMTLPAKVVEKLRKIQDDLVKHCLSEELAMVRLSFPYVESHRANHTESMRVIIKSLQQPTGASISDAIEELLRHIDFYDRRLAEYCLNNGVLLQEVAA